MEQNIEQTGEIVMYQPDETIRLEVRMEGETVWLNRQQMASLFGRDVKTIGKHINNALKEELRANQVLKEYLLRGYTVNKRMELLEQRVTRTEEKIDFFVRTSLPPVEGIFYDGQIFDAYRFVSDLIRKAKTSVVLIDNYIDDTVLSLLDKRLRRWLDG